MTDPCPAEIEIPAEDCLFKRVKRTEIDETGAPQARVFENRPEKPDAGVKPGLSTDWCKHCTPDDTRARTLRGSKEDYGVIALPVSKVLEIPKQEVQHTPIWHDPELPEDPNNCAHTDVFGPKTKADFRRLGLSEARDPIAAIEYRAEFLLIYAWVIDPPKSL